MFAAQSRGEDMEKWLKRYQVVYGLDDEEENDLRKFLGDFADDA